MPDKKIYVLFPKSFGDSYIQDAAKGNSVTYVKPEELSPEMIADANIILGNPSLKQLRQANQLEFLQLGSAGYDYYQGKGEILPKNLVCASASGAFGLAMSEYMIAVMLMQFQNLPGYLRNQQENRWQSRGGIRSVSGSVILSIGLGDIGGNFCRKVKALGAYTIGVRRSVSDKPDYLDEIHRVKSLPALLPRADVIALSIPATEESFRFMNESMFDRVKSGALLINVGRGSLIDTDALCRALESGRLGGACLDVTDPEPLPPEHPLWNMPNVLITPHVSGGWHLEETRRLIAEISADNLARYLEGRPLKNVWYGQRGCE